MPKPLPRTAAGNRSQMYDGVTANMLAPLSRISRVRPNTSGSPDHDPSASNANAAAQTTPTLTPQATKNVRRPIRSVSAPISGKQKKNTNKTSTNKPKNNIAVRVVCEPSSAGSSPEAMFEANQTPAMSTNTCQNARRAEPNSTVLTGFSRFLARTEASQTSDSRTVRE